jgi:hypothetical protein
MQHFNNLEAKEAPKIYINPIEKKFANVFGEEPKGYSSKIIRSKSS